MSSEKRITKARYDRVLWSRVCPACRGHLVVDVHRRSKGDALDRSGKYLGTFHACGGPKGSGCWHMTRYEPNKPDKALYEVFGEV